MTDKIRFDGLNDELKRRRVCDYLIASTRASYGGASETFNLVYDILEAGGHPFERVDVAMKVIRAFGPNERQYDADLVQEAGDSIEDWMRDYGWESRYLS